MPEAAPAQQNEVKNMVLLDDDFVIRQVIKIIMADVSDMLGMRIKVYTSGNGVEGLGYIALSKPNILIVDSTLPKYSGRELIEFIASNPKYQSNDIRVIVLSDRKLPMKLPPNHVVINKEDRGFVKQLMKACIDGFLLTSGQSVEKDDVKVGMFTRLRMGVSGMTVRLANRADLLMAKISTKPGLLRIPFYFVWFLQQVTVSVLMGFGNMTNDKLPDENVSQKRADLARFRVREYPTLATVFLTLFFIVFQTVLLVAGGIVVFSVRIESVFADFNPEFSLDLSKAKFDSSRVEYKNSKLSLKEKLIPTTTDVGVSGNVTSDVKHTQVDPQGGSVGSVGTLLSGLSTQAPVNTDIYPYDNPEVLIDTGVEYSHLISILEISSMNDATSSIKSVAETGLNIPPVAVTYQLSPDGVDWYYLNLVEGQWEKTKLGLGQSNTVQQVNQFLSDFDTQVAKNKKLHLKLFLHSNGGTQITVTGLKINRTLDIVTPIEELPAAATQTPQ